MRNFRSGRNATRRRGGGINYSLAFPLPDKAVLLEDWRHPALHHLPPPEHLFPFFAHPAHSSLSPPQHHKGNERTNRPPPPIRLVFPRGELSPAAAAAALPYLQAGAPPTGHEPLAGGGGRLPAAQGDPSSGGGGASSVRACLPLAHLRGPW